MVIAYSSARYLLHRLRKAMGQRDHDYVLSSIAELDDAYFGAPKSHGKRGRGTEKTSVLAAVSLTEEGHPRFFKIQVSKLDAEAVSAVAQRTVSPDSEIHSDALGSFCAALSEGNIHHYQVFDKNNGALHWVHTLEGIFPGTLPRPGQLVICKVTLISFVSVSNAASGRTSFSPCLSALWLFPISWAMLT